MNRTLGVARMQLVNKYTFVWLPLIILGASWAMSLIIFALIPYDGAKYGGGSQAPLWYFFALGITSLSYTFPFSQAMSVTRREFFLGTQLLAVLASVLLAVVFVVGGLIERATNGWGVNGYFFYLDWVWEKGALAAGFVYFVVGLLLFILGFWGATIYKRFGAFGLTVTLVALGALLLLWIWLVAQANAWGAAISWLMAGGALGLAAVGLVVVAVLWIVSFATLRHAVP